MKNIFNNNFNFTKFNKKYIILVLAILLLLITIIVVQVTYAQYITSLKTTSNVGLGSWLIKINNQDVIENEDFSDSIMPLFDGSIIVNNNVITGLSNTNTLVPTSLGKIDLTIDYSNVTTPFIYNITTPNNSVDSLDDLILVGYTIDGVQYEYKNTSESTGITNTIMPDGISKSQNLTLYLTWNDDDNSQTMDDNDDTRFSKNDSTTCNIKIALEQYIPPQG